MLAFGGTGVVVPDTRWRLRFAYLRGPSSVVEPVDGMEQATLPEYWRQAVLVMGNADRATWIGKRVRPDQRAGFDLQGYQDTGEGLVPP
jgi:hypothetical protein